MSEQRLIPCTDCDQWKHDLELGGHKFISCAPSATQPGFCVLIFEWNLAKKKATTKKTLKSKSKSRSGRKSSAKPKPKAKAGTKKRSARSKSRR